MTLTTYAEPCHTRTCDQEGHHRVVTPYAVLHNPTCDALTALYCCRVCGGGWAHAYTGGRDQDGVIPRGGTACAHPRAAGSV